MNKINKTNKIYIWMIIIISSNFCGLYNIISKHTQVYFTDAIAIMLILLSIFYFITHNVSSLLLVPKKRKMDRYAFIFLVWIIIEVIVSYIRYLSSQDLSSTIKESLPFIAMVLVYYVIKIIISNQQSFDYLVAVLIKVSVVCSVLAIISLIVFTRTGNNILGLDSESYSFIRNGRGHFMIGSMVVIPATVFLWCRIITQRMNLKSMVIFVLNLFHILYVGQTRMVIAITIVVLVLSYIVVSKKSKSFKIVILIGMALTLAILGYQELSAQYNSLISDNSIVYRLEGIQFYLTQLLSKPLTGMGFISTKNTILSPLLYGPLHRFYRTDVGYVGFINCLGIFGGAWYISALLYSIKIFLKKKAIISIKLYEYCYAYIILILLSSINLFPIDGFRILYFPVLMVLIRLLEEKN